MGCLKIQMIMKLLINSVSSLCDIKPFREISSVYSLFIDSEKDVTF